MPVNEYGQPIGEAVPGWEPAREPQAVTLVGEYARVEPLDFERHGAALMQAFSVDQAYGGPTWTYMGIGPFASAAEYLEGLRAAMEKPGIYPYAVVDVASGRALGTLALQRQDRANGSIEVGWVVFAPELRGTKASREAQHLLMRYVFEELGHRRYEWKCDALNERSIRAAKRLGFVYEGTFRNAMIYKGRNRDTAWFSMVSIR